MADRKFDTDYDIKVDDLILFFRRIEDGQEMIVNRLISHELYTSPELKIPDANVRKEWKEAVLSEPSLGGSPNQHYHVANLARLLMPSQADDSTIDEPAGRREPKPVKLPANAGTANLAAEDLVVFPPEGTDSCFRIPRDVYERCPELLESDIPDLEFMAGEEGVVLANVPKVTPQGCSCILLSLANLRSGMLGDDTKRSKTMQAQGMSRAFVRGHHRHRK